MSLDRLLNVTVTKQTRTPTQEGFGTLLLVASHSVSGVAGVQSFSSLAEAETAGFTAAATPYIHRQLTVAFSQDPGPTAVKIGRRANVAAQSVEIVPLDLSSSSAYRIIVNGEACAPVTGGGTLAAVCTAIAAAINALVGAGSDTTAVATATKVTVTASTAAKRFYMTGLENCSINDISTDGGVATDLTAIYTADPNFYGVILDNYGKIELLAAAAWCETRKLLFIADSSDSAVKDSGSTTDIAATVKTNTYTRTGVIFNRGGYGNGLGIGWLANCLTEDPMEVRVAQKKSWSNRTIAGVPTYVLTTAEENTIAGKNATFYTTVAGLNLTYQGATGYGEFLDIPQFIDAFVARLQERMVAVFANQDLRFDSATQSLIEGNLSAIVNQAIRAKQIAEDPEPIVTVPAPLDVPVADRANRLWSGITIDARLSGAVHRANLTVNLTV